jgi:hypothetical protein
LHQRRGPGRRHVQQEEAEALATHAGSETVRAEPFDQIDLDLRSLWTDGTDGP